MLLISQQKRWLCHWIESYKASVKSQKVPIWVPIWRSRGKYVISGSSRAKANYLLLMSFYSIDGGGGVMAAKWKPAQPWESTDAPKARNHVVDAHSRWKLMTVISMRRMVAAQRYPCSPPHVAWPSIWCVLLAQFKAADHRWRKK